MRTELTAGQVVEKFSKFVVGKDAPKKAVAVAISNRSRRLQLPKDVAKSVTGKDILMIGRNPELQR